MTLGTIGGTDRPASRDPARPTQVRRPSERKSVSRSATRALDVLELFGELQRPLRAIEIATALDLNPSTANQLLKTMVESAHLTFDARIKVYQPSLRLVRFGAWLVGNYGASGYLGDLVRDVQSLTGGIVTLTTPNDTFMQIIDAAGGEGGPAATERGMSVSIFTTATGMAYLSTLSEAAIRRLADRARIRESDIAGLVDMAATTHRNRMAISEDVRSGICSMATPVPHAGLHAPLVLGLAVSTEQMAAGQSWMLQTMLDATAQRALHTAR